MDSPYEYRHASLEDAPGARKLYKATQQEALDSFRPLEVPTEEYLRKFIHIAIQSEYYAAVVAAFEDEIVGHLRCTLHENNRSSAFGGEIEYFVSQRHRRVGVGSGLLSFLIRWVRSESDLSYLVAKVLETNAGSIRLLEQNGFARQERIGWVHEIRGVTVYEYQWQLDIGTRSSA
jgi:RimJ/RimL family protein N-acetyltransferase